MQQQLSAQTASRNASRLKLPAVGAGENASHIISPNGLDAGGSVAGAAARRQLLAHPLAVSAVSALCTHCTLHSRTLHSLTHSLAVSAAGGLGVCTWGCARGELRPRWGSWGMRSRWGSWGLRSQCTMPARASAAEQHTSSFVVR